MEMLVGHDWRDYFDVVIVNANKPKFFTEVSRPIRVFDKNANTHIWERVSSLEKGIIYYEVKLQILLIILFHKQMAKCGSTYCYRRLCLTFLLTRRAVKKLLLLNKTMIDIKYIRLVMV